MADVESSIFSILKENNIPYQVTEHPPVYVCEKAAEYAGHSISEGIKSMFLRTKEGGFLLVVLPADKKVDMKLIASLEETKEVKFARPEEVLKLTGLTIGSCCPFGYSQKIKTYIDRSLYRKEFLYFNPGTHTKTVKIASADLKRIMHGREFSDEQHT